MATLEKNALKWVPLVGIDYMVFVEPQDMNIYWNDGVAPFPINPSNLYSIGKNNKGLGFAKNFIKKYALEHDYDLVFKVDDDTKGFTDYRKNSTPEESAEIVKGFLKLFEEEVWVHDEIKAVAFPYSFQMFEKTKFQKVKKVQSTYIVRTPFLSIEDKEFSVFEDFSVGLNIVVNNGIVTRYGMSGQMVGVPVGKGTGGLQDFNRAKMVEVEARLLREIYPPLIFRLVDKPWKIEPDMRSVKIGYYI